MAYNKTHSQLAELIYNPNIIAGKVSSQYLEEDGWECVEIRVNEQTGYKGGIFIHHENKRLAIVHEGTRLNEGEDILADMDMVLGTAPTQLKDAEILVEKGLLLAQQEGIVFKKQRVVNIGHSLGGSLAQMTSATRPHLPAVTFNAYGTGLILPKETQGEYQHITNHVAKGDIVSTLAFGSEQIGQSLLYRARAAGGSTTPPKIVRIKDFMAHTLNHSIRVFNNDVYQFWNQPGEAISLKAPFTRIVAGTIKTTKQVAAAVQYGMDPIRAIKTVYQLVDAPRIINTYKDERNRKKKQEEALIKFDSDKPEIFLSALNKHAYKMPLTIKEARSLQRAREAELIDNRMVLTDVGERHLLRNKTIN